MKNKEIYQYNETTDLYRLVCEPVGWRLERLGDGSPFIDAWYSPTTMKYLLKHQFTKMKRPASL